MLPSRKASSCLQALGVPVIRFGASRSTRTASRASPSIALFFFVRSGFYA
jgi:hypothetical protein